MLNKLLALLGLVRASEVTQQRKTIEMKTALVERLDTQVSNLEEQLELKAALVENLEKQLKEAKIPVKAAEPKPSKLKDSYKVGYVEVKRRLKKRSLAQLRAALEKVPNNAQGFGGTAIVYRDKKVEAVNFKSKKEALQLVTDAEEGKLHLVF